MSQQDVDAIAARVAELVGKARSYAKTDPEVALGQARKAAEAIARTVYAREVGDPGKMLLNELLQKLAAQKAVPHSIQIPFGTIQVYGNFGTHAQSDMRTIDADYVAPAIAALNQVTAWFYDEYLTHPMPAMATPPAAPALEAPKPRKRVLWPFFVAGGVVVLVGGGIAITSLRGDAPAPPPAAIQREVTAVPAMADAAKSVEPPPAETASSKDLELSYRVLVRSPGDHEPRPIKSGDPVKTGDEMIFYLQPSLPAHCFVVQRNAKTKAIDVLFPNDAIELANPLPAAWTRLPPAPHTLTLDKNGLGTETVYLIASKHALPDLARALGDKNPNRAVADQVTTIAMARRTDCTGSARDLVLDATGPCSVQARGLVLDAPRAAPAGTRGIRTQPDDDVVLVPFQFQHEAR